MKTILVVEDDPSTQFVYSIWLDEYDLDCCKNATEARNALAKKQYDIVLLDINLGDGMTGLKLLEDLIEEKPSWSTTEGRRPALEPFTQPILERSEGFEGKLREGMESKILVISEYLSELERLKQKYREPVYLTKEEATKDRVKMEVKRLLTTE